MNLRTLIALSMLLGLSTTFIQKRCRSEELTDIDLRPTDVILYSAGVGFVLLSGEVNSDGAYRFDASQQQLDDLMKSIVVFGDSGSVRLVLPVDIQNLDPPATKRRLLAETIGETLGGLRGHTISLQLKSDQSVKGRIISVELTSVTEGGQLVDRELVSLLTSDGIVSVLLKDTKQWQIEDKHSRELFSDELIRYSDLKSRNRPTQQSLVKAELRFSVNEAQKVDVGWLQNMPVWKASYRLIDDQMKMWTTFENKTSTDWKEVNLTLVDGHPVSFRTPIYQQRYAERPSIPLPISSESIPPSFEELLPQLSQKGHVTINQGGSISRDFAMGGGGFGGGGFGGGFTGSGGAMGGVASDADAFIGDEMGMGMGMMGPGENSALSDRVHSSNIGNVDQPIATGADLHLHRSQVTLAKNASLSVPETTVDVDSEIVSVFSPASHTTSPSRCVQLENKMKMRLPAGPATIYSSGTFVGDMMLPELSPGIPRLIAFARDANVRCDYDAPSELDSTLESVSVDGAKKAFIAIETRLRKHLYQVSNRIDEKRTLIVNHPKPNSPWAVVMKDRQPKETTTAWRYRLDLDGGKTETLSIVEKSTQSTFHRWDNVSLEQLRIWGGEERLNVRVQETAQRILEWRKSEIELKSKLSATRTRRDRARAESSRVSSILKSLEDSTSDSLRSRYLIKLGKLEDQIESLEQSELQDTETLNQVERKLASS